MKSFCQHCGTVFSETDPGTVLLDKEYCRLCIEEADRPTADTVHHPPHYNAGKIEVLEAIEDWGLDFHAGNTVKYVARAGKKDPTKEIEDLEKGRWYLNRKIELLRAEREGREPIRPNDMVRK